MTRFRESDIFGDTSDLFLELVAEYMMEGCTQDDAEIMAENEIEMRREIQANESPGAELEDRETGEG
jgi:hypothetical protein